MRTGLASRFSTHEIWLETVAYVQGTMLKRIAFFIIGISTAALTFYSDLEHKVQIRWFPDPKTVASLSLGGVILGGVLLVFHFAVLAKHRLPTWGDIDLWRRKFTVAPIGIADLPALYVHYIAEFGDENIPMQEFARWLSKSPFRSWKVMRADTNDVSNPIGYFDLLPLTRKGVRYFDKGKIGAKPPDTDHFASLPTKANAFYVSSVGSCGRSASARGAVLKYLRSMVSEHASTRDITLYARPVTPDGERLVKKCQFLKIRPNLIDSQSYWRLNIRMGSRPMIERPRSAIAQ